MKVKFLAQGNNRSLWWVSNSRLTGIHRLRVRRATLCAMLPHSSNIEWYKKKQGPRWRMPTLSLFINISLNYFLGSRSFSFSVVCYCIELGAPCSFCKQRQFMKSQDFPLHFRTTPHLFTLAIVYAKARLISWFKRISTFLLFM